MRPPLARALALYLVLGVVASVVVYLRLRADRPDPAPTPAAPSAPSAPTVPGIVVLCLDTLRADALSLDSGRPVRMPRLEALATASVVCADAVAPSAWTSPSVVTLLTGLDPDHTGVYGLYEKVSELSSSVVTLPRRLADAGFDTAAIVPGGWVDPSSRVFAACREVTVGLDVDPAAALAAWNRRRPKDKPFFLYLHSLAAHDPYLDKPTRRGAAPPPDVDPAAAARAKAILARVTERVDSLEGEDARWIFEQVFRSERSRLRIGRDVGAADIARLLAGVARWLDDGCERDPEVPALGARMRAAYDESLAGVDAHVGAIVDALDGLGLPADVPLVVVADHGETFAEHGTLLHGRRVDDELLRVPFLVRGMPALGPPRLVRGAVGLVDVTPTILEWVGRPLHGEGDGISLLSGLREGATLPDRALRAIEERRRHAGDVVRVERLEAIRTPRAKCVLRRDPATHAILGAVVFRLDEDPGERAPIPFEALDRPCALGDAFARALRAAGLAVPCLEPPPRR